jgi:hypothetical protein
LKIKVEGLGKILSNLSPPIVSLCFELQRCGVIILLTVRARNINGDVPPSNNNYQKQTRL